LMVSWCFVRVIRRARPVRAVRRLADRRRNPLSGFSRLVRINLRAPHARLARRTSRKVLENTFCAFDASNKARRASRRKELSSPMLTTGRESEEGEILTSRVFWPSAAASLRPCKLYSAVLTGHGLQICTKRLLRPVSESRCGGVDHQGVRFSCRTLNPFSTSRTFLVVKSMRPGWQKGPRPFFNFLVLQ